MKGRATLVNVVLSFYISPLQTTAIFIIIFYQLIFAEKRFKTEGKFLIRFDNFCCILVKK